MPKSTTLRTVPWSVCPPQAFHLEHTLRRRGGVSCRDRARRMSCSIYPPVGHLLPAQQPAPSRFARDPQGCLAICGWVDGFRPAFCTASLMATSGWMDVCQQVGALANAQKRRLSALGPSPVCATTAG
jgi:hypothetical protein